MNRPLKALVVSPLRCILPTRRKAMAALSAAALGACGSSPPVQLYHLRADPPVPVPAPPSVAAVLQLMQPVRVPEYLDREAVLLPQGQTGLLALSGHRWAESLRDAVPRILRQDLAALLGESRVWVAPVPAGVAVAHQLRVELLGFEAESDRLAVRLQARWTWIDAKAGLPPVAASVTLRADSSSSSIDALVAAHRLALWRLAERIAASR